MGIYATVLTLGTTLPIIIQKLFIRYKKFDNINHRSSHSTLATRTGGIGIFSTLFIITIYQYALGEEIFDFSILIPLSIMFIIGVYDDLYDANFKLKFILQIIVAKILIDQGYVIQNYHGLFGLYEIPWLLAQLSTIFVFLVVVNAINLIDGIDGLAITQTIVTTSIIELISSTTSTLFTFGKIVMISLLPLYYFNFRRKNKVFLGDSGSLLLGSIVMIYLIHVLGPDYEFKSAYTMNKCLFSVIIIVYPLIDLLRVFTIRIKNGESPFSPDNNHIHHYLSNRFKAHWITTLIIQLTSISITILIILCAKL